MNELNLNSLIGAQLIFFNNIGFVVRMPTGEIRSFAYVEYGGDCCGYNELETSLFFDEGDLAIHNPVIVNVTCEERGMSTGHQVTVTFYGANRKIAMIDSYSGSGSGWCYGANVTLQCIETGEETILSEW